MHIRLSALLLAACLVRAGLGADVFCAPDTYKFKPDGSVIEFGGKPAGKLAEANAIFSKAKASVSLAGAKNETVAFQVIVDGPAKAVAVSVSDLKAESGEPIPAARASVYLIGFVQTGKNDGNGVFADVCVPLSKLGGSFDVPYAAKGLLAPSDQKVGLALVEVAIPSSAKPGHYTGSVKVSGGAAAEIKLELTVWNFEIPAQPSIVFDVNAYGSPVADMGVKDQKNPYAPTPKETIEAEHECYRLFNQHRMYLNIMPCHSQRGAPYYTPALHGDGKDTKCDWKNWDDRFGAVLSGEIFDDKQPPPFFYLPFNLHWPYGYSHDEKMADKRINFRKNPKDYKASLVPEYEETFKTVAKQYVEHFAEKGWKKTGFQVFLNHSNQENANSPWRLDEPYNKFGFAVLQWFAKLTDENMRDNDKGVKFRYRIDIGHWNCRDPKCQCFKPKEWEPDDGEGMLEPWIDDWYLGAVHAYGNRHRIPKLLAKGPTKEAFIYGGGGQISGNAAVVRSSYWTWFDMGLTGFCAWKVGMDPIAGGKDQSGGDSVCYSGKDLGFAEPLASLRMKLFRRGSYDAEYLKLAKAKDADKVKALLAEMVPYKTDPNNAYKAVEFPYPNNNPGDWELARLELAGIILGKDLLNGRKRSGRLEGQGEGFVDQITGY
ncbi:MAG: hypothetical protein HY291_10210 [Planctomycetes bacterium]|nr:hypothetical protein [Planctomycetota bacterium]